MRKRTPLPTEVIERIRENIHPAAHWAIADWNEFSWHKDSKGAPDTFLLQSSQALCISIWGTIAHPDARQARSVLAGMLVDPLIAEAMTSDPELHLEFTDAEVLYEKGGNPTNVDVLLLFPHLVLVVESKFTERFGSCSQVSRRQCTGRYERGSDLKTRSEAPCRLAVSDGRRTARRYWDVMRSLSVEDAYPLGVECPFAGPGYQVMRNVAFASELAASRRADWRTIFAFPQSLSSDSAKVIEAVAQPLRKKNSDRVLQLDYERLADALAEQPDSVSTDLARYLSNRIEACTPSE